MPNAAAVHAISIHAMNKTGRCAPADERLPCRATYLCRSMPSLPSSLMAFIVIAARVPTPTPAISPSCENHWWWLMALSLYLPPKHVDTCLRRKSSDDNDYRDDWRLNITVRRDDWGGIGDSVIRRDDILRYPPQEHFALTCFAHKNTCDIPGSENSYKTWEAQAVLLCQKHWYMLWPTGENYRAILYRMSEGNCSALFMVSVC